jgi:hypothetical protein
MKRTGFKPRASRITRGKPIARKRRKPEEFARIYGSRERVEWVKSLPCLYCAALSPFLAAATVGQSQNCHTVTGGTGRKAGYETIIPLCAKHHRMFDEYAGPFADTAVREALTFRADEIERVAAA